MQTCSITRSEDSRQWPEGIISVKVTMNPYIFAMAIEEAYKCNMQPWELVNLALWEKLGKPDRDTLTEFAANLETSEDDPKWKKRLRITAAHEAVSAAEGRQHDPNSGAKPSANGEG